MDSDNLPLSRSTTDRDALNRPTAPAYLESPDARIMQVRGWEVAVVGDRLALEKLDPNLGTHNLLYLGKDHLGPVFADVKPPDNRSYTWSNLRNVGAILPAREAGLATAAVSLANWHSTHTHCPRCGHQTDIIEAGWVRVCPKDGSHHFPRTDSAVIMAIVDSADRILLAHNALWPENRFSVPAGYVEPGEPLEAAVRREVWEETAIRVGKVWYQGSQPWPFPASLMVGFRGKALNDSPIPDGEEITEVRFFSREEVTVAVGRKQIILPGATSIARYLIEDWYGSPIDDE